MQGFALDAAEPCRFGFRFSFLVNHDSLAALEGMMSPKQHETTGSSDLFRVRLEQIINMAHELVQIAGKINGA